MPWLLTMLVTVAGIFADELAPLVLLAPLELRLIVAGALLGLGVAFVMSALDARALARRRHAPHLCDLASHEELARQ